MSEKVIVNAIIKYLKSLDNCFCFKEHGGIYGTAGIPDIICCYTGKFLAFEVKTEQGKVSEIQKAIIAKINKADGVARIVRNVEEVKAVISEFGGEIDGYS